jgi:hypothetical protein
MPVIELKADKTIIDYWQTPYLRRIKAEVQGMISKLKEAHTMHIMRK